MTWDTDKDGHGWQKELRIVLLGWDQFESCLVGNAILGHVAFDPESNTEVCVRKQGSTAETRLTVVNTPPNWLHYAVGGDSASVERRLATSASLCQPGPHIYLMVIPVDCLPLRERSLEAALLLLSDILWQYTIVVFTGPEKLTEPVMTEDMAKGYRCLQSILEKCGHRNHYLSIHQLPQDSVPQVQELLKAMMALAAVNQAQTGEAFLSTERMSEQTERRIALANERAEVRKLEGQKECQTQKRLQTAIPNQRTTLRVVMVGAREAGKSTAGNVIFGQDVFQSGHPTIHWVERKGDAVGRNIVLIDTPGWEHRSLNSQETPSAEARLHNSQNTSLDEAEPNAFLLVVSCNETFTDTDKRLLQEHLTPWGRDLWRRGIILFTHGDQLGQTAVEQHIERWPALVWLVDKCANRYHVLDNVVRTCNCKVKELVDQIEAVDLINDSQGLLQALLKAERDKAKQRSKVKELQKRVRDLQRDYEQQEKHQEERDQRLQEVLQSCNVRENHLREKEERMKEKMLESEEQKKEHQKQIELLIQRCSEQERKINELMKKEDMKPKQSQFDQVSTKELDGHKQWHGDQNGIENICSDMESVLQNNNNTQFVPPESQQLDRQREVKNLSLSEPDGRPEKRQTDRGRTDSMGLSENMPSTEPPLVYVELNSPVVPKVEQPTQEITTPKQLPQPPDIKPVATLKRFEGAAVGALIGTLTGLRRGALRAAMGTAIGASVGALLDEFLRTSGKP